ncbi:MAG TPA: tyrosine--tRNA ligase [Spirochaetota bacterium]|nr:tyrosine--tRNA ligase [Spirochaetota bacterium]
MTDFLNVLKERGFIAQISDEPGITKYLGTPRTAYCGFDPTADSLHVGHLVPIMALSWFEKTGHRPIAIVGGGTAMIGDPSGRTELRKMLTVDQIMANAESIKMQLSRYMTFSDTGAILVNNADWLRNFNYIDFLRDIGRHFSVNRMIAAETYKARLEHGLSFIEFNYQILQAYDFLHLCQNHGCRLQMGGNDQWGNIVAGIDLIRRIDEKESYGLTFPLITTASGAKMGKTSAGAVWLDAGRTTPYDYYQFWRNTEDADVGRFLALFTCLPMDEVRRLAALQGEECNEAKKILALEATAVTHGRPAAETAADWKANMPETVLPASALNDQLPLLELLVTVGACASKGEGRRLVQQGGIMINDSAVTAIDRVVTESDFQARQLVIRVGKKKFYRVVLNS